MKINSINSFNTNNYYKTNYENNKNYKNNPSFGSNKDDKQSAVTNSIMNIYKKVSSNNTYRNFTKKLSHYDSFTHLMVAESGLLAGFYMYNTYKNKNIEDNQKPQMLINETLTLGFSTAGAYLAEDKITNVVNKQAEKYFDRNKSFYVALGKNNQEKENKNPLQDLINKAKETFGQKDENLNKSLDETADLFESQIKNIVYDKKENKAFSVTRDTIDEAKGKLKEKIKKSKNLEEMVSEVHSLTDKLYDFSAARKEADDMLPKIHKAKVIIILGLIYRFLGPVAITPIANRLSKKFFPQNKEITK